MMAIEQMSDDDLNENIEEIKNLSEACEIETVSVLTQNVKETSNATFIGKGKVDELKDQVEHHNANLVVFNVQLSPSQIRNLEASLEVDVIDKNMLILEIFKRRAKTPESKAQVEIAHLKYIFPRMIGSYESLGRQVSGFGNRNRGLGETKLELDRRTVDRRIQRLEKDLEKYQQSRQVTRKKRLENNLPLVALVGYTNAGKSSLMNVFQDNLVFVEDMLFASLETASRRVDLDDQLSFILHDTVGFIQNLPHHLVNAFHATLEEIRDADLLLHVIDRSNPHYEKQKLSVENTLKSMNIGDIPIINVYNKIDKISEDLPESNGDTSVYISTKTRVGIDRLTESIKKILWRDFECYTLKIPYDKMVIANEIIENLVVLKQKHTEAGIVLEVFTMPNELQKYEIYLE
ncbi:MAG TPA: GTPase HflX [Erysipelothrix sp.]|nr:GTPase HflX [Erysipelothrix sp.]